MSLKLPRIYNFAAYETFALILLAMLVDHLVYYFLYDNMMWLRVAAHMMTPALFMALGYNVGRKVSWWLVGGAILSTLVDWYFYKFVMPFNPLVTIIVARLLCEPLYNLIMRGWIFALPIIGILLALLWPAVSYMEYGTAAIIFALAGRFVREKDAQPHGHKLAWAACAVAWAAFMYFSVKNFGFTDVQNLTLGIVSAMVTRDMFYFKQQILEGIRRKVADPVRKICRFFGHKTFELYMVHIILFKVMLGLILI